jgi:hypothetical protein
MLDGLDKWMIHIPGGVEQRFHYATQNGMQCKTYELFISGIFHLTFLDLSWLQVAETMKRKTSGKMATVINLYFTYASFGTYAEWGS